MCQSPFLSAELLTRLPCKMDAVAATSLLLAVCISCLLFTNAWKKMFGDLPPGPTPLPLVGNLLQMKSRGMVKYLNSLQVAYGPVFTIYMGPRPVVVLCGYKALKEAFIDQGDEFLNRGRLPLFERIFNRAGVLIANDELWKKLRPFTVMTLKDFGMGKKRHENMFNKEAQCMVDLFRKTNGELCDPSLGLKPAAANNIFTIIFGERFDYEDEKFHTLLNLLGDAFITASSIWGQLYGIFPGVMYYMPGPHNRMFKIFEEFGNLLNEYVKSHPATLDSNSPRDFIDSYLIKRDQEKQNESSEFHIKNLVPTIMGLIFAGAETISKTLRYGLLYLLKYPEVEEIIHKEIDQEIGQQRSPSYEDRNKMPYTQAVIHETQRFCNIIPLGVIHGAGVSTKFRGYTIPKGTDIIPNLTSVQKDPTQFKDPDNFNPENFLDENGSFKKNNAFVPFSLGKRNCPAESMARMEIFLLLTNILQNFNLKSPIDPKDIDLTPLESGFENVPPSYKLSFIPR